MDPIRIFVGAAANNEDLESQAVLEYSLRKYATLSIDITWMQLSRDPVSFWYSDHGEGWNTSVWTTPFSGFRWAIPHLCNFQGRAIYMDSDMIVQADIAELWKQKFVLNKAVIAKGPNSLRYCVALFDCARMQKYLPKIEVLKSNASSLHAIRHSTLKITQAFSGNWNCCDGENYKSLDDPDIKVLHYTSIPHQLHLKHSIPRLQAEGNKHWYKGPVHPHPRAGLQAKFDCLLAEASEYGYRPNNYRREPFGEYHLRWAA